MGTTDIVKFIKYCKILSFHYLKWWAKANQSTICPEKSQGRKGKALYLHSFVTTVSCFLNKEPHKWCSWWCFPRGSAHEEKTPSQGWHELSKVCMGRLCSLCHQWVIEWSTRLCEGARWPWDQKCELCLHQTGRQKETFPSSSCPDPGRATGHQHHVES